MNREQNRRYRLVEISDELKSINQRRRELLEERRRLTGVCSRTFLTQTWIESIFSIIEENPGISRQEIFVKFNNPHMTFQDLTNCLTMLRRRGWIENRGTRQYPEWHSHEKHVA